MKNIAIASVIILSLFLFGCDDDSLGGRGYRPPPGVGAILVENDTMKDWNMALDGEQLSRVGENSFKTIDRLPGIDILHLDEHKGDEVRDVPVQVIKGTVFVVRITGDDSFFSIDTVRLGP